MTTVYENRTRAQKDKANARTKKWHDKNRDKIALRKRAHYAANIDKYITLERERQYQARYGIGIPDYDRMLESQGGRCFICNSDKSGKETKVHKSERFFAVDHDHITGMVRGLLCLNCNSRLGWYEKNKDRANQYLDMHKTTTLQETNTRKVHK